VIGLIIGRGGETIRYFQEQSGARVKVDLTGDPNAEERNVCITGTKKRRNMYYFITHI
jgi:hypothetical protein